MNGNASPLSPKVIISGIIITVSGGIILAWIMGEGPFARSAVSSEEAQSTVAVEEAELTEAGVPAVAEPRELPWGDDFIGDIVMEINFAEIGEGACNNYDPSKLGYDNLQYYIQIPPNEIGWIAACHANDYLLPQGTLQVRADPQGDPATFGYAVLFGWEGAGLKTTDACIFGIRQTGSGTEAVFVEWIEGKYSNETEPLPSFDLDNRAHTLQVSLQRSGLAQGSLDGRVFAEHRFSECPVGPIGLVAWGPENSRVYFDDLKLFDVP